MLRPSVPELLDELADALAETVLPELADGPARDQVRDAVALTRRLASAVPRVGAYLHEDTADVAATLRRLWDALEESSDAGSMPAGGGDGGRDVEGDGELTEAVAFAEALGPQPPPTLDQYIAANLRLRAALADAAEQVARRDDPAAEELLQEALARLARRERELGLSPWARVRR